MVEPRPAALSLDRHHEAAEVTGAGLAVVGAGAGLVVGGAGAGLVVGGAGALVVVAAGGGGAAAVVLAGAAVVRGAGAAVLPPPRGAVVLGAGRVGCARVVSGRTARVVVGCAPAWVVVEAAARGLAGPVAVLAVEDTVPAEGGAEPPGLALGRGAAPDAGPDVAPPAATGAAPAPEGWRGGVPWANTAARAPVAAIEATATSPLAVDSARRAALRRCAA